MSPKGQVKTQIKTQGKTQIKTQTKPQGKTLCGLQISRVTSLIGWAASRFHERYRHIPADDFYQEGWLAVLSKQHLWNAHRGKPSTFIVHVAANRMKDLRRTWNNQTRPEQLSSLPDAQEIKIDEHPLSIEGELSILRRILSPLAWRALSLRLKSFPARPGNTDVCNVLGMDEKTGAGVSRELRQVLELVVFYEQESPSMLQNTAQPPRR